MYRQIQLSKNQAGQFPYGRSKTVSEIQQNNESFSHNQRRFTLNFENDLT